jgi:hypothetical protein
VGIAQCFRAGNGVSSAAAGEADDLDDEEAEERESEQDRRLG